MSPGSSTGSKGRKVFADEEAIETLALPIVTLGKSGRKVFADEEAIETGFVLHPVLHALKLEEGIR